MYMSYTISVSQLVRYWLADTSTKKRTVAKSLLNQPGGAPYYRDFNSVIQNYVRFGQQDEIIFEHKIQELRDRCVEDQYEKIRIEHNIRVLTSTLNCIPFNFCQNTIIAPDATYPKIQWHDTGMEISIAPDFMYTYTYRRKEYVGAIKLFYAEMELTQEHANFVTALIKYFLNTYYSDKKISDRDCRLFNINTGEEYTAPQSIQRRLEQIREDCCDIYSKIERSI